jgi:hypothetical protein
VPIEDRKARLARGIGGLSDLPLEPRDAGGWTA